MRLKKDDEQALRAMLKDWKGGSGGYTASLASLAGVMGEIDALRHHAERALAEYDAGGDGHATMENLRKLLPAPEPEPMVRLRVMGPSGTSLEGVDVDPLG